MQTRRSKLSNYKGNGLSGLVIESIDWPALRTSHGRCSRKLALASDVDGAGALSLARGGCAWNRHSGGPKFHRGL